MRLEHKSRRLKANIRRCYWNSIFQMPCTELQCYLFSARFKLRESLTLTANAKPLTNFVFTELYAILSLVLTSDISIAEKQWLHFPFGVTRTNPEEFAFVMPWLMPEVLCLCLCLCQCLCRTFHCISLFCLCLTLCLLLASQVKNQALSLALECTPILLNHKRST